MKSKQLIKKIKKHGFEITKGRVNRLKTCILKYNGIEKVEVDAKVEFKPNLRNNRVGVQILADLGVEQIRFITNNPKKVWGSKGMGLPWSNRSLQPNRTPRAQHIFC